MLADRPVRAVCVGICMVLIYLPTRMYFHTPPKWTLIDVLSTGFPGWLILYGYLFMLEGRDQERERRERADQEKKSPPP
jgi:hypothetical protein